MTHDNESPVAPVEPDHALFVARLDQAMREAGLSGRALDRACTFADSTTSKLRTQKIRPRRHHIEAIARATEWEPLGLVQGTGYELVLTELEESGPLAEALAQIDELQRREAAMKAEISGLRSRLRVAEEELVNLRTDSERRTQDAAEALEREQHRATELAQARAALDETRAKLTRAIHDRQRAERQFNFERQADTAERVELARQRDAWREEAVRLSGVVQSVQAQMQSQMPAPLAALLGAGLGGLVGLAFANRGDDDDSLLTD